MPTLNWIGKDAVVRHHKEVPFRLLEPDKKLSHGDSSTGNLIVEGDNLQALKSLLPRYAGKVKCIYIDPPYNTGNEGWVYNDRVNSPEINRWLGSVVGREAEDLSRHDKWLCMMYPRLVLLKQFLREDGAILVSLDSNESASLRLLMDEIFGRGNFVSEVACVNKPSGRSDDKYVATAHETITIYRRSPALTFSGFPPADKIVSRYSKKDNQGDRYREEDLRKRGDQDERTHRPNLFYPFFFCEKTSDLIVGNNDDPTPEGYIRIVPMKTSRVEGRWRWERPTALKNFFYLHPRFMPNKGQWSVFEWEYLKERGTVKPTSVWDFKDVNSERGTELFSRDLGFPKEAFPNPKPIGTIERIIQIATDKDSIILDSFAGSGTTGHAVLKQNAADGGNRKFILVEMEPGICKDITAERVRRVAGGYTNAKGEKVEGLGGGFQYCRLSKEPLFDATGAVREDVRFAQLAEFVWFAETGTGITGKANSPLLGVHEGVAVYLLYNGILKDKSVDGGNVLTAPVLSMLPLHDGSKVIYAAASRLGAPRLQRERIVFKQTPYALDV
jgi:DNA modification methylase